MQENWSQVWLVIGSITHGHSTTFLILLTYAIHRATARVWPKWLSLPFMGYIDWLIGLSAVLALAIYLVRLLVRDALEPWQ